MADRCAAVVLCVALSIMVVVFVASAEVSCDSLGAECFRVGWQTQDPMPLSGEKREREWECTRWELVRGIKQ
jgi:hypothetical protein